MVDYVHDTVLLLKARERNFFLSHNLAILAHQFLLFCTVKSSFELRDIHILTQNNKAENLMNFSHVKISFITLMVVGGDEEILPTR